MSTLANKMDTNPQLLLEARANQLNSWKQIAHYLGREVRTVQRWEKSEGLPVRRHVHGRGATVYAYTKEVDLWRARRSRNLNERRATGKHSALARSGLWLVNASRTTIYRFLTAGGLLLMAAALAIAQARPRHLHGSLAEVASSVLEDCQSEGLRLSGSAATCSRQPASSLSRSAQAFPMLSSRTLDFLRRTHPRQLVTKVPLSRFVACARCATRLGWPRS
jgi:hypothetical protein